MNNENYLKHLIYCSNCYTPSSTYYVSDCMHLICVICIKKDFNHCPVCYKKSKFSILTDKLHRELINNPSENFHKSIEISMFQLGSALNLILHLQSENRKYKELLMRMKEQLHNYKGKKTGLQDYNMRYIEDRNKHEIHREKLTEIKYARENGSPVRNHPYYAQKPVSSVVNSYISGSIDLYGKKGAINKNRRRENKNSDHIFRYRRLERVSPTKESKKSEDKLKSDNDIQSTYSRDRLSIPIKRKKYENNKK